ncbi:MAG: hypothetical protein ACYC1D_10145 [Acidimicrobiales bacterium]
MAPLRAPGQRGRIPRVHTGVALLACLGLLTGLGAACSAPRAGPTTASSSAGTAASSTARPAGSAPTGSSRTSTWVRS